MEGLKFLLHRIKKKNENITKGHFLEKNDMCLDGLFSVSI